MIHGGHSDQDQSYRINPGDRVDVMWPDKSVSCEVLVKKTVYTSVSDMGHDDEITYSRPIIKKVLNGKIVEIMDFNGLRFKRV